MLLMFTGNLEGTSLTSKMLWKRPGPPAALVVLAGIMSCIFIQLGLVIGRGAQRCIGVDELVAWNAIPAIVTRDSKSSGPPQLGR